MRIKRISGERDRRNEKRRIEETIARPGTRVLLLLWIPKERHESYARGSVAPSRVGGRESKEIQSEKNKAEDKGDPLWR